MKKKILLCILMIFSIIFVSCSSDIEISESESPTINPPSWIIGTWSNTDNSESYKFTTDNVYNTFTLDGETSPTTRNLKEKFDTLFNEYSSSTSYEIDVPYTENSISHIYREIYLKTSTTTLLHSVYQDDVLSYFEILILNVDETPVSIINPPSWIIGTWSNTANSESFKFTTDNVYDIFTLVGETSSTTWDLKEYIRYGILFSEYSSSTTYEIDITFTENSISHTNKEIYLKTSTTTLLHYFYEDDVLSYSEILIQK